MPTDSLLGAGWLQRLVGQSKVGSWAQSTWAPTPGLPVSLVVYYQIVSVFTNP